MGGEKESGCKMRGCKERDSEEGSGGREREPGSTTYTTWKFLSLQGECQLSVSITLWGLYFVQLLL